MIELTKLNGEHFYLDATKIETVEETPNTVITITSGKIFIVQESSKDIVSKTIDFYKEIYTGLPRIIKKKLSEDI